MRKYDSNDSIGFDMIKIMEQKSVVSFTLWRYSISSISWISLFVLWAPFLRIRGVRHYCVQVKRIFYISVFVCLRPVVLECICISCVDIVRRDSSHYQVHSGEVISFRFQFLCVIDDRFGVFYVFCYWFPDIYQERSWSARRIVDFYLVRVFEVMGDDLWHQEWNFMWSIELSCLFPSICCKVWNQIFVDKP